jgi:hypothetical protein
MKTFNEINYDNYKYINFETNKGKIIEHMSRTFSKAASKNTVATTGKKIDFDFNVNLKKGDKIEFDASYKPQRLELDQAKIFLDESDILQDISKKINIDYKKLDAKNISKQQKELGDIQQDITAKVIKKLQEKNPGIPLDLNDPRIKKQIKDNVLLNLQKKLNAEDAPKRFSFLTGVGKGVADERPNLKLRKFKSNNADLEAISEKIKNIKMIDTKLDTDVKNFNKWIKDANTDGFEIDQDIVKSVNKLEKDMTDLVNINTKSTDSVMKMINSSNDIVSDIDDLGISLLRKYILNSKDDTNKFGGVIGDHLDARLLTKYYAGDSFSNKDLKQVFDSIKETGGDWNKVKLKNVTGVSKKDQKRLNNVMQQLTFLGSTQTSINKQLVGINPSVITKAKADKKTTAITGLSGLQTSAGAKYVKKSDSNGEMEINFDVVKDIELDNKSLDDFTPLKLDAVLKKNSDKQTIKLLKDSGELDTVVQKLKFNKRTEFINTEFADSSDLKEIDINNPELDANGIDIDNLEQDALVENAYNLEKKTKNGLIDDLLKGRDELPKDVKNELDKLLGKKSLFGTKSFGMFTSNNSYKKLDELTSVEIEEFNGIIKNLKKLKDTNIKKKVKKLDEIQDMFFEGGDEMTEANRIQKKFLKNYDELKKINKKTKSLKKYKNDQVDMKEYVTDEKLTKRITDTKNKAKVNQLDMSDTDIEVTVKFENNLAKKTKLEEEIKIKEKYLYAAEFSKNSKKKGTIIDSDFDALNNDIAKLRRDLDETTTEIADQLSPANIGKLKKNIRELSEVDDNFKDLGKFMDNKKKFKEGKFLESYVNTKTLKMDNATIKEMKLDAEKLVGYGKLSKTNKARFKLRKDGLKYNNFLIKYLNNYPLIFNRYTALMLGTGIGLALYVSDKKSGEEDEDTSTSPSPSCELIENPYSETEGTKYKSCELQLKKEDECKLTKNYSQQFNLNCKSKKEDDEKCSEIKNENENYQKCKYCKDLYPTEKLRTTDKYNELKSKYPNKKIFGYYGNCQCTTDELEELVEINYTNCQEYNDETECKYKDNDKNGLKYLSCKHSEYPEIYEGQEGIEYNDPNTQEFNSDDEDVDELLDLKNSDVLDLTEDQINLLCEYYKIEGNPDICEGIKEFWNFYHVLLADRPDLQKDFYETKSDLHRMQKMSSAYGLEFDDDGKIQETQEFFEFRQSVENESNINNDDLENNESENNKPENNEPANSENNEDNLTLYIGIGIAVLFMIIILIVVAKS